MSKEVFEFTDDQIQFVKDLQYRGEIADSEVPMLQHIYLTVIGVENVFCATCNDEIAVHTNRLIDIVEESIRGTLRRWQPSDKEELKVTLEQIMALSNTGIAKLVYDETGKKIHGNRQSLIEKATNILIDG